MLSQSVQGACKDVERILFLFERCVRPSVTIFRINLIEFVGGWLVTVSKLQLFIYGLSPIKLLEKVWGKNRFCCRFVISQHATKKKYVAINSAGSMRSSH